MAVSPRSLYRLLLAVPLPESFRRNGEVCKRTTGKAGWNRKGPKHALKMLPGGTAETQRTQSTIVFAYGWRATSGMGRNRSQQVRGLSRVCALTARSADGTELLHGLPRLWGLDRRLLEALGLNLDAPLPEAT